MCTFSSGCMWHGLCGSLLMWTCGCQWCLFYALVCCGTTSYVHGGVTQVCCAALRNRNTGSVPAVDLAVHLDTFEKFFNWWKEGLSKFMLCHCHHHQQQQQLNSPVWVVSSSIVYHNFKFKLWLEIIKWNKMQSMTFCISLYIGT